MLSTLGDTNTGTVTVNAPAPAAPPPVPSTIASAIEWPPTNPVSPAAGGSYFLYDGKFYAQPSPLVQAQIWANNVLALVINLTVAGLPFVFALSEFGDYASSIYAIAEQGEQPAQAGANAAAAAAIVTLLDAQLAQVQNGTFTENGGKVPILRTIRTGQPAPGWVTPAGYAAGS